MKIFVNKEIRKLFLALSVIWMAALLLTQGFLYRYFQRISLFLLLVFALAGGLILSACYSWFPETGSAYGTGSVTDQRVS